MSKELTVSVTYLMPYQTVQGTLASSIFPLSTHKSLKKYTQPWGNEGVVLYSFNLFLLITTANSLDPGQEIVGPGLDPNGLTLGWYS